MTKDCKPGNDCCKTCKDQAPATERFPLLQGRDLSAGSAVAVLTDGPDVIVWGPASVEGVSEDAKLVRMTAIEAALPAAFRRGLVSILHKDQAVGRFEPLTALDEARAPAGRSRALVRYLNQAFGGAPTGVLVVTQEIAEAFPHLQPLVGSKQFFCGSRIYGDTETARLVQAQVRAGNLDAYSISAMVTESALRDVCDEAACRTVQEIHALDLSAVTLGSRRDKAPGPFSAKVRNPGAAFIVLQQAHDASNRPGQPLPSDHRMTEAPPADAEPKQQPDAVEQAQPADTAPQAAAAAPPAPAPVEQADEAGDDFARRLELVEQRLASLEGKLELKDEKPAEPEEAADEKPADEEKPADKPADEKPDEVEQAAPAPAIDVKALEQALLTKATQAAEARFQALLAQARPAETPLPASPADPDRTPSGLIYEAATGGNPNQLLTVLESLRSGRTGEGQT